MCPCSVFSRPNFKGQAEHLNGSAATTPRPIFSASRRRPYASRESSGGEPRCGMVAASFPAPLAKDPEGSSISLLPEAPPSWRRPYWGSLWCSGRGDLDLWLRTAAAFSQPPTAALSPWLRSFMVRRGMRTSNRRSLYSLFGGSGGSGGGGSGGGGQFLV